MGPFLNSLLTPSASGFRCIIAALLILLVGWIIAKIVAAITRKLLGWIKLDNRLAKGLEGADEKPLSLEGMIVKLVYYLTIFIAILAALNALGLTGITAMFAGMLNAVFALSAQVAYALVLARHRLGGGDDPPCDRRPGAACRRS